MCFVLCVIIAIKEKSLFITTCYHGFYLNNRAGLRAIYQTLGFGTILGTKLETRHDKHERNVHTTRVFFKVQDIFHVFFLYDGLDCWSQ